MTPLSTEDFPYTVGYVMELLALDERQLTSFVRVLNLSPKRDDETGRTLFTHRDIELLKKAADMQRHGDDLDAIARQLGSMPTAKHPLQKPENSTPDAEAVIASPMQASPVEPVASSPMPSRPPVSPHPSDSADSGNVPPLSALGRAVRETGEPPARRPLNTGAATASSAHASRPALHPSVSLPGESGYPGAMTSQDSITTMVEAVSQVKEGILKDLGRLLDDKLAGLDEVVVELIRCKSENDSLKKKLNEAVQARETMQDELSRFKPVQFGFFRKL